MSGKTTAPQTTKGGGWGKENEVSATLKRLENAHAKMQAVLDQTKDKEPDFIWTIETGVKVVGRDAELKRLDDILKPAEAGQPTVPIAITGPPGTGRSTLAQFACQRHRSRFTSGWMLNASSYGALTVGLFQITESLRLPRSGLDAVDALLRPLRYRLEMPDRAGWLIVMEDVNPLLAAGWLEHVVPRTGGCVVMTLRKNPGFESPWHVLPLTRWARDDSVAFLKSIPALSSIAESTLRDFALFADDNPYTLSRSYPTLLSDVWSEHSLGFQFSVMGGVPTMLLPTTIDETIRKINNVTGCSTAMIAVEILLLLDPADIPPSLLRVIYLYACNNGPDELEPILNALVEFGLVSVTDDKISYHPLLQKRGRTRIHVLPMAPLISAAQEAFSTIVLNTEVVSSMLHRRLLVQFFAFVLEVSKNRKLIRYESVDVAEMLEMIGEAYVTILGDGGAALEPLKMAVQLRERSKNTNDLASVLILLGQAYSLLRNVEDARPRFDRAVALLEANQCGNTGVFVDALTGVAACHMILEEYDDATRVAERALSILPPETERKSLMYLNLMLSDNYFRQNRRSEGNKRLVLASTLSQMENTFSRLELYSFYVHMNNLYESIETDETTEEVCELLRTNAVAVFGPDHVNTCAAYHSLGIIRMHLGRYTKALEDLKEALRIRERVYPPDYEKLAELLTYYGHTMVHENPHDSRRPIPHYQRAIDIRVQHLGQTHAQNQELQQLLVALITRAAEVDRHNAALNEQ